MALSIIYTSRRLHCFCSYLTFKNFQNGGPWNISKQLNVHLTALSYTRLLNVSERYELVNIQSYLYSRIRQIPRRQLYTNCKLTTLRTQPRPQGLLLVQNGGRRNPWPRLLKYSKNRGVFCHVTHDETASSEVGFSVWRPCLSFGNLKLLFKRNEYISKCLREKILTNFWSNFGSLGQGFLRPPFWTRRRPWGRGCFALIGFSWRHWIMVTSSQGPFSSFKGCPRGIVLFSSP